MSTVRVKRAESLYFHEISQILRFEANEPRLRGVVPTMVRFTPDLKLARIFFTVPAGEPREEEALKGFRKSRGYLRKVLAERVPLRFSPDLEFVCDDTQEMQEKMDRIFDELHNVHG